MEILNAINTKRPIYTNVHRSTLSLEINTFLNLQNLINEVNEFIIVKALYALWMEVQKG